MSQSFASRAQNFIFSKDFIKSLFQPFLGYVYKIAVEERHICSHTLLTSSIGPVSNFGIPVAAVLDLKKDPQLISGPMTGSLVVYSLVFMRYATAVTPWNPLLFGCHFVNEIAQLGQSARWVNYWYFGGRERALANPVLPVSEPKSDK